MKFTNQKAMSVKCFLENCRESKNKNLFISIEKEKLYSVMPPPAIHPYYAMGGLLLLGSIGIMSAIIEQFLIKSEKEHVADIVRFGSMVIVVVATGIALVCFGNKLIYFL